MTSMHYIGFDIHRKVISFCEKKKDGGIVEQERIIDRCNGSHTLYGTVTGAGRCNHLLSINKHPIHRGPPLIPHNSNMLPIRKTWSVPHCSFWILLIGIDRPESPEQITK